MEVWIFQVKKLENKGENPGYSSLFSRRQIVKNLKLTISSTFLLAGSAGCASWFDRGESMTAVGSTALQLFLVEAAVSTHIGKTVNVQGGGSGTGLFPGSIRSSRCWKPDAFAEEKTVLMPLALS